MVDLLQTHHRPWPLPPGSPRMDMSWHDLLFIHYPVPTAQLRALIPGGLEIDLHENEAWIGLVPFRMSRVKPCGFPSVPGLSAFPELNVRTYVTRGGKSGVWFFSLDAANPAAVAIARTLFHLPYFNARMSLKREGEAIIYHSDRTHRGASSAGFAGKYRPSGLRTRQVPARSITGLQNAIASMQGTALAGCGGPKFITNHGSCNPPSWKFNQIRSATGSH